jgi:signal transduction histidine kinase
MDLLPRGYSASGADPRAVAGGGILVAIAWTFVAVHTATALDSTGRLGSALGVVVPLGLAATLFAGAICVYRYGLAEAALRISGWTLFGTLAFAAVIGGAVVVLGPDSAGPGVSPVILINVAAGGAVLGLLVGLYDARQRRLRRQLTEEHRRADDFRQRLSVLSRVHRHDFRNKINLIVGTTDRLLADADADADAGGVDAETVRSRALTIRDAGTELGRITEELRELERLRTDSTMAPRTIDLVPVVDTAVATVRGSFPDVTVRSSLPATLSARASPLVARAIGELLDNAARHNDGPRIDVDATRDDDSVVLTIRDDGSGIPSAEVAVHRATEETSLDHSDGLGLWLVAWIVDRSEGSVHIECPAEGGTVVTIRLSAVD